MTKPIIDEKIKAYLVACLVTGIDVESEPDVLMTELVDHMNSTERIFWTEGDEDGVIVHNKNDVPVMYITYNGRRIRFRAFEEDELDSINKHSEMGYALLNIIGFLQSKDLSFQPSIMGSERHIVETVGTLTGHDSSEDWSL